MDTVRKPTGGYFGPDHPLAVVAVRLCRSRHSGGLIGGVACGECWERVIRDDERVVVEFDLPRELDRDGSLVDEVAVERACRGDRVRLTAVERRAAVTLMAARGLTRNQIVLRLHVSWSAVCAAYPVADADRGAA